MQHVDSNNYSSDYEAIFQDVFTDIDISYDTEEILNSDSYEENKLLYLTKMGYSEAEASIAIERCGPYSSIAELTDFICAAQMAKVADALLPVEDRKPLCNDPNYKKRQNLGYDFWKRKKQRKLEKNLLNDDDHAVLLLNPMIGFGVPTKPNQITQRTLPEDAIGPPYFYYKNVALAPVGAWTEMLRSAKLTERIRKALEAYDDEPPSSVHKYVLDDCRKWNLVWVGRNKVVPLELDEVEMLLEPWKGLVDDKTGYLYFWNLVTNVTQYERHTSVESIPIVRFKFNNLLKDIMIDMEEVVMINQDLSQHHGITRVQMWTCSFS
ncbi:DNA (Cytosine-5)-methyltransferase DRM1/2 isoform 2 [Hibiscus syriacus]|uniref:DNA (Cytosine-5)-methyltransferase DRM1/2 isoform 2 n=1 Tax=Hibiscus syriacus TaxID=106335 RepID=A0A6A3D9K0_HIBSY|nr:DNA (Cytosine-5)-methyltransferase DRM1/2 isoform 2 [Hibiscus syriacus]